MAFAFRLMYENDGFDMEAIEEFLDNVRSIGDGRQRLEVDPAGSLPARDSLVYSELYRHSGGRRRLCWLRSSRWQSRRWLGWDQCNLLVANGKDAVWKANQNINCL